MKTKNLNSAISRCLNAFWKELGEIEKRTGVKRESIALTLCRLNSEKGKAWEAALWNHSYPKGKLESWIRENLEDAKYSENAFLELAKLLPTWARRSLIEIARTLPAGHGGKRRALRFQEEMHVVKRFRELTLHPDPKKQLSNNKAYEKIARELKGRVHLHTVRMICDPRERNRKKRTTVMIIGPANSNR